MLLAIDPIDPEPWLTTRVVQALRRGGVAVLPTDTVYAIACGVDDPAAVEHLYEVKEMPPTKRLSLLVPDIATASRYARAIPDRVFRAMRRVLPGPYTFIFSAGSELPRVMLRKRRTVGIRIPDSPIVQSILAELGKPLFSTSVRNDDDEWVIDPADIAADLGQKVEIVVDAGLVSAEPSTVVDASGDEPVLVREGKGDVTALELFAG